MTLILRVTVEPGTHIDEAGDDCIKLANKLGVRVELDFNESIFMYFPWEEADRKGVKP